jgi:isoleucyl-tRNA synthetase
LTASESVYELLNAHKGDLRYLFIVSQVDLVKADADIASWAVKVQRAGGEKCERCWNYSVHVGESSRFPTVCERCIAALEEIEKA